MAEVIRGGQTMTSRKIEKGDVVIKATPREVITRGGGGGGGTSPAPTKTQETLRRSKGLQIEKEKNKAILKAEQEFVKDIRKATSIGERQKRIQQLREERLNAELIADTKKIEAGIITGTRALEGATVRGVSEARALRRAIEGKEITQAEARALEKAGVKFKSEDNKEVIPPSIERVRDTVPVDIPQKVTIGAPAPVRIKKSDLPPKATVAGILKAPVKIAKEVSLLTTKTFEKAGFKEKPLKIEKELKEIKGTQLMVLPRREGSVVFTKKEIEARRKSPATISQMAGTATGSAVLYATPAAILSPAFVVEGTEIALDETKKTGERLMGVAEAELGLLIGGLATYSYLKKVGLTDKTITLKGIKGKAGKKGGGLRQVVKEAKKKAKVAKKKKAKVKINPEQARKTFGKLTRTEQINILEKSFRNRIHLDAKSLKKDIDLAKKFMKDAGLNKAQVSDRLKAMLIRKSAKNLAELRLQNQISEQQFLTAMKDLKKAESKLRLDTQKLLTEEREVFTPLVATKGELVEEARQFSLMRKSQLGLQPQGLFEGLQTGENLTSNTALSLRMTPLLKSKQKVRTTQKLVQTIKTAQDFVLKQKEQEKVFSNSQFSPKILLALRTVQKQPELFRNLFDGRRKTPPKRLEEPLKQKRIILSFSEKPTSKKKILDIAGGIKAFEVQVKRFGKFKPITEEPLPKGKALKLGAESVEKSLARTFRLIEKGTTKEKDITFGVSPKLFRKPKKDEKLTFIQRKELAFGTKLETAEAQKARMKLIGKVKI